MNEYEKLLENIERLKTTPEVDKFRDINAELEKFITILKLKGNNDDENY